MWCFFFSSSFRFSFLPLHVVYVCRFCNDKAIHIYATVNGVENVWKSLHFFFVPFQKVFGLWMLSNNWKCIEFTRMKKYLSITTSCFTKFKNILGKLRFTLIKCWGFNSLISFTAHTNTHTQLLMLIYLIFFNVRRRINKRIVSILKMFAFCWKWHHFCELKLENHYSLNEKLSQHETKRMLYTFAFGSPFRWRGTSFRSTFRVCILNVIHIVFEFISYDMQLHMKRALQFSHMQYSISTEFPAHFLFAAFDSRYGVSCVNKKFSLYSSSPVFVINYSNYFASSGKKKLL